MTAKSIFVINQEEVSALVSGRHGNPHHLLGMHTCLSDLVVNVYAPEADTVAILDKKGKEFTMEEAYAKGFYTVTIPNTKEFAYQVKTTRVVWDENGTSSAVTDVTPDPYNFGYSVDLEKVMAVVNGADDFASGFKAKDLFGAREVELDGTKGVSFCMHLPGVIRASVVGDFNSWNPLTNQMRKIDYTDIFELFIPGDLTGARYKFEVMYDGGATDIFSDPYATCFEEYPGNASMLTTPAYDFKDGEYMAARAKKNMESEPVNIYEVHLPTWKAGVNTYTSFGKDVAKYVKSMGYTHVELMPLMEYANENTWGYDTVGTYAPTSRFGTPADFMAMVDHLHSQGIGVIMDMVPVMDIDCLTYWLDTYHLDGIRLDNGELVAALKEAVGDAYPGVLIDSTWNINATELLVGFMADAPDRRGIFADMANWNQDFICDNNQILALSHDMVAYGKGALLERMPGGYEDKYADLRTLYGLTTFLPGKKLMCMGQELGAPRGFSGQDALDWTPLEFDANKFVKKYLTDVNKLYLTEKALYESPDICIEAAETPGVTNFTRGDGADTLYVVANFSTADVKDYTFGVEKDGAYKEIISSDAAKYGGEGHNNTKKLTAKDLVLKVNVPALSIAVFKKA